MTATRPRRSLLYVPGSNARALEKARGLAADGIILDLEDAVAPAAKEAAREAVMAALRTGFGAREVVVRINALDTPWGEADLAAATGAAPDAVLVPKVDSAEDLVAVGSRLRRLGAPEPTRVWAMVETPLCVLRLDAVASAARDVDARLDCLVLGTNDLAKDLRMRPRPGRSGLVPFLALAVAAARAHDLDVLDGVYNAHADSDGFSADCVQARELGFDGKTLIHPGQIAAANAAFSPDAAEIAEARAIVAAFTLPENSGRNVIALDGRMVERLHADEAARTLGLAELAAGRGA